MTTIFNDNDNIFNNCKITVEKKGLKKEITQEEERQNGDVFPEEDVCIEHLCLHVRQPVQTMILMMILLFILVKEYE